MIRNANTYSNAAQGDQVRRRAGDPGIAHDDIDEITGASATGCARASICCSPAAAFPWGF
jgi:hypothetical protein